MTPENLDAEAIEEAIRALSLASDIALMVPQADVCQVSNETWAALCELTETAKERLEKFSAEYDKRVEAYWLEKRGLKKADEQGDS